MTIRSCATVYGDHTDPGWSATDWVLVFLADELHNTVDVSDQHREEGQVLLSMAYAWFTRHLPIPGRIARHFKRRNSIWGICWFDPRALEAVSRARYCSIGPGSAAQHFMLCSIRGTAHGAYSPTPQAASRAAFAIALVAGRLLVYLLPPARLAPFFQCSPGRRHEM